MSSDKILDVQGVTVSFDGFKVLQGLDFSVNYGELRFLIGPNGAGKTTLLDIITGKTRPTSGKFCSTNTKIYRGWRNINGCSMALAANFKPHRSFPV
jgi:ABC-type uncharacterized transport system ATPase subunit